MKTVLITGASGGIGRAMVKRFLDAGDFVFAQVFRHPESLGDFTGSENFRLLQADLSNPAEADAMFKTIRESALFPDILINNAGIACFSLLQEMSVDAWDSVMNTNLRSAFLCSRAVLPEMIRRQSGVILNISSVWGEQGSSTEVAYSASKGGLNAFTRALAKEEAPSGIRVNAIACGVIDTEMNAHLNADEREALTDAIGLGRYGRPDEVAELAYFLCSDSASYLTGAIVALDGGFPM